MRVVLATAGVSIPGGIASVARSVADVLERTRDNGDLEWIGLLALHGDASPVNRFDSVRTTRSNQLLFVAQLLGLLSIHSIDLVIFDSIGLARASQVMQGPLRRPYVVFAHGDEIGYVFDRRSAVRAVTEASRIITVSPTSHQKLVDQLGPGLPPIQVIPPCVARDRIEAWSSVGVQTKPRRPMILSVGRMERNEPGKGHDTLIRSHRLVVEEIPEAQLILVGDGDNRSELEALARREGISDHVHFPGFVTDEELGELYRSATLFAMPSRQEGFGIVYAEAMWHGLPCIGSTSDAAVDVIDHERTGLLVPFGESKVTADAICRLLTDPAEARAFGENGRLKCLDEYLPTVFERRLLSALPREG